MIRKMNILIFILIFFFISTGCSNQSNEVISQLNQSQQSELKDLNQKLSDLEDKVKVLSQLEQEITDLKLQMDLLKNKVNNISKDTNEPQNKVEDLKLMQTAIKFENGKWYLDFTLSNYDGINDLGFDITVFDDKGNTKLLIPKLFVDTKGCRLVFPGTNTNDKIIQYLYDNKTGKVLRIKWNFNADM